MTECRDIRPELGAYVLGGLEPDEAADVRLHLGQCPECAREYAELAGLPAKLDLIEAPEEALQRPAPGLEEAILDRHARERRALRDHAAAAPARQRKRKRKERRPFADWFGGHGRLVGVLASAAAAIAVATFVIAGGASNPVNPPSAGAAVLNAGPGAPSAHGTAWLKAVPAGTSVHMTAMGLPARKSYEMWCVRYDGRWVSAGTFTTAGDGHADVRLTAAVRSGEYGQIFVTPRMAKHPAAMRGAVMGY
jgi:anti-sigma factor RsiW